ncbi:MAG: hypothetical protein FRX49_03394 [Trebouxia sp. A1-2]|nr:MAG: hypothetical protein FRX49_03394 [Trebouxia sp. A1-2]
MVPGIGLVQYLCWKSCSAVKIADEKTGPPRAMPTALPCRVAAAWGFRVRRCKAGGTLAWDTRFNASMRLATPAPAS